MKVFRVLGLVVSSARPLNNGAISYLLFLVLPVPVLAIGTGCDYCIFMRKVWYIRILGVVFQSSSPVQRIRTPL